MGEVTSRGDYIHGKKNGRWQTYSIGLMEHKDEQLARLGFVASARLSNDPETTNMVAMKNLLFSMVMFLVGLGFAACTTDPSATTSTSFDELQLTHQTHANGDVDTMLVDTQGATLATLSWQASARTAQWALTCGSSEFEGSLDAASQRDSDDQLRTIFQAASVHVGTGVALPASCFEDPIQEISCCTTGTTHCCCSNCGCGCNGAHIPLCD